MKRSNEQDIRNKKFFSRNVRRTPWSKNQETKQRVRRILGDCWQWETHGPCVKGDKCSFRHDMNKRGKVCMPSNPSPNSISSSRMSQKFQRQPAEECLDGLARMEEFCNNSFCQKWHPSRKTKSGCRFGEKCSFAHRQVDEQPTKSNDDKSAVAMLKKEIGKREERDRCLSRSNGETCEKKLGQIHLNDHPTHGNWVAYFRT